MSVHETLIKKWKKLFHYRDTDHDGIVIENDYKLYAEHFVTTYGERAKPAREISKLIWETFTPKRYKAGVTESEFLDSYMYLWNNDRQAFKDKIEKYCHLSFDAIDSNGDGEICFEEYSIYQKCFGIDNIDYIELIFQQIDTDGNGCISRFEFVDTIMDYVFKDAPEQIPEMYDPVQAKTFKKI